MLRDQIADGEYTVGDQLPTEKEIGEAFGVSRVTVRRALRELAAEGLLERQPGRGTFLKELPVVDRRNSDRRLIGLRALLAEWTCRNGTIWRKGRARASKVVRRELGLNAGGEAAFFVKICSDTKGPDCGMKRYFHSATLPFLDDDLLSAVDFDAALARKVKGTVEISRCWIESILAEPRMVMILGVPVGSPLLSIWYTTTVDKEIFCVSQMLIPGNSVGIEAELWPLASPAP